MTYRILVTGSRDWTDWATVHTVLTDEWWRAGRVPPVVVHGACPTGADAAAVRWAQQRNFTTEAHPANWRSFGRAAGPIRNQHMVDLGADVCLAFIRNGSRGATHCAALAEAAGIPVRRWTA